MCISKLSEGTHWGWLTPSTWFIFKLYPLFKKNTGFIFVFSKSDLLVVLYSALPSPCLFLAVNWETVLKCLVSVWFFFLFFKSTFKNTLDLLIYFMWLCLTCMYVCALCACLAPMEVSEAPIGGSPGTVVAGGGKPTWGCWAPKFGPLQEQQALSSAEPPLQPMCSLEAL